MGDSLCSPATPEPMPLAHVAVGSMANTNRSLTHG
jgi:hypothetical protein